MYVFKGTQKFDRNMKDMSKFSPRWWIQRCCYRKLFSVVASQWMFFSWKRWRCAIYWYKKLYTCLARTAIIAALTTKNSDMPLTEQGENPNWVNYISTQLEPSAVIYPNGGPQLDNRKTLIRGLPLSKNIFWVPAQSQTQVEICFSVRCSIAEILRLAFTK